MNPEIPECDRETNAVWLQREMKDLREALDRLQRCFDEGGYRRVQTRQYGRSDQRVIG